LAALPPPERLKRIKTANDHLVVATRVDALPHGTPCNIALLRRHFVGDNAHAYTTADTADANAPIEVKWHTTRGQAEALARLAQELCGEGSPQRLLDWLSQKSAGGIVGALLQLVQEAREDGAPRRDMHCSRFNQAFKACAARPKARARRGARLGAVH
jgi:hypothetical protein